MNELEWQPVEGWPYMFRRFGGIFYYRGPLGQESFKTRDLPEACEAYIAFAGRPAPKKGKKPTHREAWELYFAGMVGKPSTENVRRSVYANHILGLIPEHAPIVHHDRDFANAVLDAAEAKRPKLSDNYLRAIKATLGAFGAYCALEGWLTSVPSRTIQARKWMAAAIRSKKSTSVVETRAITKKEIVSDAELAAIVTALGDPFNPIILRRRTIAQLMVMTGLRINECLALTKEDVQWDDGSGHWGRLGSVLVNKQIRDGYDRFDRSTWFDPVLKANGEHRVVPLYDVSHQLLKTFIEVGELGGWLVNNSDLLFASSRAEGGPLNSSNLGLTFSVAAERAGIERRITSHYFRHTYATMLFSLGYDYKHVARRIGNSEKVCRDVYVQFIPKGADADDFAERMARR